MAIEFHRLHVLCDKFGVKQRVPSIAFPHPLDQRSLAAFSDFALLVCRFARDGVAHASMSEAVTSQAG